MVQRDTSGLCEWLEEILPRIMRPAFLCAAGDAWIDDAELDALDEVQEIVSEVLQARDAILEYMKHGSLKPISYISDPVILYPTMSITNRVPLWLDDLLEARRAIDMEDDLIELYREQSRGITDTFEQRTALFAMLLTAEADGEVSDGEFAVYRYFAEECWDIGADQQAFLQAVSEVLSVAKPV